jgi:hypothetical protein
MEIGSHVRFVSGKRRGIERTGRITQIHVTDVTKQTVYVVTSDDGRTKHPKQYALYESEIALIQG